MVLRPVVCRPFVGRRDELSYLNERRRDAAGSHGALVLVAGEAGIGKSRLLAELCAPLATSRWRVATSACLEHAPRPYGPVVDVLKSLDRQAPPLAPAVTKRDQLDEIVERFARISAKNAVLAVIEDIHWADTATLEFLAFFAPRLERLRMLIVASFRPDELQPDDPSYAGLANVIRAARGKRVDLTPLGDAELRTFIDAALDGYPLAESTRRTISQIAEGNPFFTEELLKSAVERGAPANGAGSSGEAAFPSTIRATLLERLRPLADVDRHVIAQAAVIGRTFDTALLARTLGTDAAELLPALQRARAVQLVEELSPARFRFRHALTRETIYAGFLRAQLQPLHRTIATALEDGPEDGRSLEGLAYHWWAAGDQERATRYNDEAGDAAGRLHAHEDAIAFYARALEAASDGATRAALIEKIGYHRGALGHPEDACASLVDAADAFRDAGDFDGEARCRVRAAITAYTLRRPAPIAQLESMLERLGSEEYLARSRVHLGLAWLDATFWYPTRAARHLAAVDPRALRENDDIALRYHNVAAWVAMTFGDVDAFRREHARWVEAAHTAGGVGAVAAAHYNGAACFAMLGLHAEGLAEIDRALAVARAERSRHGEESALAISAFCWFMCGDLERTRAALAAVPPSTQNQVTIAHGAAWGTLAGLHLGDDALVTTWFDRAGATIMDEPETSCGAGFAEVLVRRGRPADAAAVLRRSIPECERIRGNALTLLAAARYADADVVERARAQLVAAADAPVELMERFAIGLFDAYVAHRDGRHADAVGPAAFAAEGFERLEMPLLAAAAHEAAGAIDRARELYARCGTAYDAGRLGGRAVPADPGDAPNAAREGTLSEREREIALLVARGKSNAEIGRELSISHKTVEKHLGSVYGKLGLTSRVQLAAHVGTTSRTP
jgi:DNA-binding CsgD family transcriptional regulator